MKFDVPMPGNHHIPGTYPWSWDFTHADWTLALGVIDDLGFFAVSTSEHIAMPHFEVPRLGPYWQYAPSVMAFIAGATKNVRIDASVLVLPYHHPLVFAKEMATIDVLSGGRLNISVGAGHAEQEFVALGSPFADRGAVTDETIEAVLTLWTEAEPVHRGKHFSIEGLAFEPKPLQKPRPPIYVGGNSRPALRRAARFDGWQPNPTNIDVTDLAPLLDYMMEQPGFEAKRDTFDINWVGGVRETTPLNGFAASSPTELRVWRDQLVEAFSGAFAAAGVTRTSTPVPRGIESRDEFLDYLRWFSSEVISKFPS